jgi:peptidoglycan/LPS O-acetylase OafA/YrhL
LSIPLFAGYLIFWFAFLPHTERLNQINNKTDISYGTYLYAWPIQELAIRFIPDVSPLVVLLITLVVATSLASLSWLYVEEPCSAFNIRRRQRSLGSTDMRPGTGPIDEIVSGSARSLFQASQAASMMAS